MTHDWMGRARGGLRKPPRVIVRRLADELRRESERWRAPRRAAALGERGLLRHHRAGTVDELWERLAARPYVAATALAGIDAAERARVAAAAERALRREVDLLGSGPTTLTTPVDWHVDFKTGHSWPLAWARSIDYANLERPSDVKVPWELSRLQWLLPAAQSYLVSAEERLAEGTRALLDEWIAANPYGGGVNWAVAMEPALRVLSWTYLFHAFARSAAWAEPSFRSRFLRALHLQADWVERHLERSDVNGNHYTADAAGLAFAGLFFDERRWSEAGWTILVEELPRQILDDGVDFEGSLAYHRLVTELFLLPALYRDRIGLTVPAAYRERLSAAAVVAALATRDDGTTPLLGDADDARALPLGGQALGDHRYLAGLVAAAWDDETARAAFSGPRSEIAWLLGPAAADALPDRDSAGLESRAFPDGGLYVLRGGGDHVLVDCGPVGLAGRGGHGHNDCLSFEAALDGVTLVTDSGSYVYTASPEERNRFRATAAHCTPLVDGVEQNPIPSSLWQLEYRAVPTVEDWDDGASRLRASHAGYERLGVTPVRTVSLDRTAHRLRVVDELRGSGSHHVVVPYHLAPEAAVELEGDARARVAVAGRAFAIAWTPGWQARVEPSWISPSYGIRLERPCLVLTRSGPLARLEVTIEPAESGP